MWQSKREVSLAHLSRKEGKKEGGWVMSEGLAMMGPFTLVMLGFRPGILWEWPRKRRHKVSTSSKEVCRVYCYCNEMKLILMSGKRQG